jgi:multiple sugar transport system substrate-binding protein
MRKATRILILALVALLAFGPAALAGDKVTIITIANDRLAEQEKALREACPDIDFEMIGVPDTDIVSKVQVDAMSGTNQYDIISSGQGAVQFGLSGIAEELPELDDWSDIFEGTRTNYMSGGKIYGYPVQADTCLLFYRPSLLKAAGYDAPPKTFEEFREMAIKLTTDAGGKHPGDEGFDPSNIAVYGAEFHGGNFDSNTAEFINYFMSFGAEALTVDSEKGTYAVTVNSPEAVEALSFVVDNYKKYQIYPEGIVNYDWSEHHTMFVEGKVALAINYAYMYDLAAADTSKVKDDFAATAMPAGPGGARTAVGGWAVSLAKGSQHKEEAMKLMKWLASAEGSLIWSDFQGALPTRKSVVEKRIAEFEGVQKGKYEAAIKNLEYMQSNAMILSGASYDSLFKIMNATVNAALTTDITPQQALDSAKAQMESVLEKNKFMK